VSFLRESPLDETLFAPFVAFRRSLGYVPNLFRAQTLRPDVVQAETDLYAVLVTNDSALSRRQKECIMLVASVASLNSYCVAGHSEMLRHLGFGGIDPNELAADHRSASIPETDKALLDFVEKLTRRPDRMTRDDIEALRGHDFADAQILEAVQVTALSAFLSCLAAGLGAVPDEIPKAALPEE
jgi:uncharacterized peroxidase-related enzyme